MKLINFLDVAFALKLPISFKELASTAQGLTA